MVEELPGTESTLTHADLAKLGLDLDTAFELGIAQGAARVAEVEITKVSIPGAKVELIVANDLFLSALMLSPKPPGSIAADIKCAISWHHWMIAELEPIANRATLEALQALVEQIAEGVKVAPAEGIGTSLWFWPTDSEPTPFALDALPAALSSIGSRG